jgi:predicted DCC family thiol-disulfide oxidoreductase YuxK
MNTVSLKKVSQTNPLVLYDGICHLCNSSVQFLLKRDKQKIFRFAPLQEEEVQKQVGNKEITTVILLYKSKIYTHSDAAIQTLSLLNFPFTLFKILLVIPKFIRDPIYKWVAKNRYSWFGKSDQCILPDSDQREQFLFL